MNRQEVKSLLQQEKYQEIENNFREAGYELDEQNLLKRSQSLTTEKICNVFWESANFLASNDNLIVMNSNEHLKAYLEKSFFAGKSVCSLQEVKAQLPVCLQNSLDSKEEIVKKLWEGLQVIDKNHLADRIAWAAHLDLHF